MQAQNATIERKHKTQALMGATRPASGIKAKAHRQAYRLTDRHVISAVCEPFLVYEPFLYLSFGFNKGGLKAQWST